LTLALLASLAVKKTILGLRYSVNVRKFMYSKTGGQKQTCSLQILHLPRIAEIGLRLAGGCEPLA
jgi:hypothetical protein